MTGTSAPKVPAEAWARGVAVNPAATADVLLRLLSNAAKSARHLMCEHRDLSGELVSTILVTSFVRLASGPRGTPGRRAPSTDEALKALLLAEHPAGDRTLADAEMRSEL